MGYTHYWTHKRRFTNDQWFDILTDISAILFKARDEGFALGHGDGETPLDNLTGMMGQDGKELTFNGLGDDSHETFCLYQNRRPLDEYQTKDRHGWDFCKTARKPYDVAVTAILCYLESCYQGQFSADSDGDLTDWTAGLELARRALPSKTNILQEPLDVRFDAQFQYRSDMPSFYSNTYRLRQRTNGQWCFFKGEKHKVLAYVTAANAAAFEVKARAELSKVPRSGYGDELARKADRALRNLLTYCATVEMVRDGAPSDMLLM